MRDRLAEFLAAETAKPIPAEIDSAARALAARYGAAVSATLFYGSCRRSGRHQDGIVDLYLLVDSYRAAHRNLILAAANRLLPPNVSYAEILAGSETIRFKYGIVTLSDFARRAGPGTLHPAVWGRFAQPVSLLWTRDDETRDAVIAALADAARTLLFETLPLMPERFTARAIWIRALSKSYRTELRAERAGIGERLYHADAAHYDAVAERVLPRDPDDSRFRNPSGPEARERAERRWRLRRWIGKPLSMARLVKSAFTFQGGADYILWKVERHSGVRVPASPWQRRHPLLSGPVLAWRLYRKGGFR